MAAKIGSAWAIARQNRNSQSAAGGNGSGRDGKEVSARIIHIQPPDLNAGTKICPLLCNYITYN
jgi:hypothetical protein